MADKRLEPASVQRILAAAERLLAFLERFARPRLRFAVRELRVLGVAIAVTGFVFALPLYLPFGNMLSAMGLVLMGLGLLEEDGLLASLGLMLAAASLAYHIAGVALAWEGLAALARMRP
ncbi:MAG: hypothetical protein A2506_06140 [Elusimicrobia bacterium RIFOXYD12_FULL_66_9]|nr:MAG: hypothetical protein A2506_06140 [Elusimicrobia bacterium RIFOXYD12_FULL_66_9]